MVEKLSLKNGQEVELDLDTLFKKGFDSSVKRILLLPSEEIFTKAVANFDVPACRENRPDCFEVVFVPKNSNSNVIAIPSLWKDPLKVHRLSEGLKWLLASLYFVGWIHVGDKSLPFNDEAKKILKDKYLKASQDALREANVSNAIYSDLGFIQSGIQTGRLKSAGEIEQALHSVVLGYLALLMKEMPLDINTKKNPFPNRPLPPSSLLPPASSLPTEKIEKKMKEQPEPSKKPEPKNGEPTTPFLTSLELPPDKKQRHYQIEFVVDASGSMADNTRITQDKVENIISFTKNQLQDGGQVTIGVRMYVDSTFKTIKPLDSEEVLEQRKRAHKDSGEEIQEVRVALQKIIDYTEKTGGSIEFSWDAGIDALNEEPFSRAHDVERVLFILTDEPGDVSGRGITLASVINRGLTKGVRVEVVQLLDPTLEKLRIEQEQAHRAMLFRELPEEAAYLALDPALAKRKTELEKWVKEGGAKAQAAIADVLEKDPNWILRKAAAEAIATQRNPKTKEILKRAMTTDEDWDVREQALESLLRIKRGGEE